MEELLKGTTAYAIFRSDREGGRLAHAYLVHYDDADCLYDALKFFAVAFFNAERGGALYRRIWEGSFPDVTFYPEKGKKITVDGISEIIADCALRPVEGDKKLYVISDFSSASALVQNKLLKTLEEPPEGVYFILGALSLAPVLDTVKSRVRLLEIPPFTPDEIYAALCRRGENDLNTVAAESSGGSLGAAINIVNGGWYIEVHSAAEQICAVKRVSEVPPLAQKYGDIKYKKELLFEMQNIYMKALRGGENPADLPAHTLIYALECLNRANADMKFNAYFAGLLYDLMLRIAKENEKWQKSRE